MGKKVLTFGVVATTILWSVGFAALVPLVASATDVCPKTFVSGDQIKVTGAPAIYVVDNNNKVVYFPSGDEYKSWNVNNTYGGYTTVSQACFDSLSVATARPNGVTYRPGSTLVKRPSSSQLYVVEPGYKLAKITVEAARAIYGTGYRVMTVLDVHWPDYIARGDDITTAIAHEGMLVSNSEKTWYIDAGNVKREVTSTGLTANRFRTTWRYAVPNSVLTGFTTGSTISEELPTLTDRTQSGVR